nr:Z-carotene desaturase [Tanacetum cinerariifolium]
MGWGCREILYEKSVNGDTYVTGLAMSKATQKKIVKADAYIAGDPYMPLPNEEIIRRVTEQVLVLFPSSQGLEVTWSSVVKIAQSLYREGPGKDPFRPDQKTPVKNFFLAGSYTKQVLPCHS